jgi:hypothetical protein
LFEWAEITKLSNVSFDSLSLLAALTVSTHVTGADGETHVTGEDIETHVTGTKW